MQVGVSAEDLHQEIPAIPLSDEVAESRLHTHTGRPAPRLSFLNLAASADGARSSREAANATPCRLEEVSDMPDTDPGVPMLPAAEVALAMGNATVCIWGLLPVNDVVRVCAGGGMTKRSATDDGGDRGRDRGKDMRIGKLPGELARESLCWFFRRVGVNPGPSSCERNREDRSDSLSNTLKSGAVRYVTDSARLPLGCGTAGKSCSFRGRRVFCTSESGILGLHISNFKGPLSQ